MRCKYCNEKCVTDFCGDDCRSEYESYNALVKKYGKILLLIVLGPIALLIPGFIFGYFALFMAAWFFIAAIAMMVLPFCNTHTVEMVGVKRSITLARWAGVFLIVMGLFLLLIHVLIS